MPAKQVYLGQMVKARAGRDIGRNYVIVGKIGSSGILVADGRSRRLIRPKKKNIRHVDTLKYIDGDVAAKLQSGAQVTDEDIRRALAVLSRADNS